MKKTVKKANSIVFYILRFFLRPALYLLYRYKFDMKSAYFNGKKIKRPCFILANHQTSFDQFAVGLGFNFGINFIASDTIFRYGLISKLMMLIGRPIPFSKGSSDMTAVKNMMSVIKEGGSIGMFPSGNRSFYGDESTIVDGIGKLIKKFGVPLVLVQLRGGFNTLPRWKKKPNIGKMTGSVTKVVDSEELKTLASEEIDKIIKQEICFNEFEFNYNEKIKFLGKNKSEYLESVLFYCPVCSSLKDLKSQGNDFYCQNCEAKVRINDYGFFEKIKNAEKIPDTILEWSKKQIDFIKNIDYSCYKDTPLFSDNNVKLFLAERAKKEIFLEEGTIKFFNDKFTVGKKEFLLIDTTMAVQGVRKFTVYNNKEVFAVKAPYRTNFMKYMICGYHIRNKILNLKEEYYGY